MQRFWAIVALVTIGLLVLRPFFPRQIGGAGGGSEKAIVGLIWVLSAIGVAIFMYHHTGRTAAEG